MISKKINLAATTLLLLSLCLPAVAGGGNYNTGPGCANGLRPCVPARITYGYYPTTWRRWPSVKPEPVKTEPEALPTPAKRPAEGADPSVPPSKTPSGAPVESTPQQAPGGTAPPADTKTPPSDTDMPLPLPFEDSPEGAPQTKPDAIPDAMPDAKSDAVPGAIPDAIPGVKPDEDLAPPPVIDSTAPSDTSPTEDPPEPPKDGGAVPQELNSRDDNPFKDEAPKDEDEAPVPPAAKPGVGRKPAGVGPQSPAESPRQPTAGMQPAGSVTQPIEKKVAGNEPIRWRVTARSQAPAIQLTSSKTVASPSAAVQTTAGDLQVKRSTSDDEPRHLPRLEVVEASDRGPLPASNAKANPLRSSSTSDRKDRVAPTANWTVESSTTEASSAGWRANPLRGN